MTSSLNNPSGHDLESGRPAIATMPFASRICGTGSAYPERVVTNDQLAFELAAKGIETSDQWISERTGIRQRRLSRVGKEAEAAQETNSLMAARAARQALEAAGTSADQIDMIIVGTCSPDTLIPSTACWIQKHIGANRATAFDLNAACSGFVYALSIADRFISSGQAKKCLVVGSEVLSSFTDWDDRTSCILFGDGAGAVVVESVSNGHPNRILSCHTRSDGELWDLFYIPGGGSKFPLNAESIADKDGKMKMKGREIFKIATKTLADFAVQALEANGISVADLDWLIPHQANMRIIEAVAKRLDFPKEKIIMNVQNYGNTSSATVPTALDEAVRDGRIKKGQLVLMDVFGAGLTYGSILMRW